MTGIILDVAIVVLTILLLIFGIWRGMYKLIFGLVSALLAVILAVILVSPVTTLIVDNTELDARLAAAIDEPLSGALPNGNVQIEFYDMDGDGEATELGCNMDGQIVPFAKALEGTPYAMLSGVLESVVAKNIDEKAEDVTLIGVLSAALVGYIITAIVFVVLLIVFAIVVALIMKLIKTFVTHTYLGHFVDKVLGAVLGLAISAVVVWGALAIIRILGTYEWIIPVNDLIKSSTLTKALYENNFLYNIIVDTVDIKGIIDGIISGLGGQGGSQTTEAAQEIIGMVSNVPFTV